MDSDAVNQSRELNADTVAVLEQIYDRGPQQLELDKLKISFWDKLVIVDAGALALSLTAAGFFRGHSHGDGGVGYLLAAWKLLIGSMAFAIMAQWILTSAAVYSARQLRALATQLKLGRIEQKTQEFNVPMRPATKDLMTTSRKDAEESGKLATGFENAAHICGAIAQVGTLAAFMWLYVFARVNLIHLTGT